MFGLVPFSQPSSFTLGETPFTMFRLMCVRSPSCQRKSASSTAILLSVVIVPIIGRIRKPRHRPSTISQIWIIGSSSFVTFLTAKSMSSVMLEALAVLNCEKGLNCMFKVLPAGMRKILLFCSVPSVIQPSSLPKWKPVQVLSTTELLFLALSILSGFCSELLLVFGLIRNVEPAVGWNPPVLSTSTRA